MNPQGDVTISNSPRGSGPRPTTVKFSGDARMSGFPAEWNPGVAAGPYGELGLRLERSGVARCLEDITRASSREYVERSGFTRDDMLEMRRVLRFNEMPVPAWMEAIV